MRDCQVLGEVDVTFSDDIEAEISAWTEICRELATSHGHEMTLDEILESMSNDPGEDDDKDSDIDADEECDVRVEEMGASRPLN